MKRTKYLCCKLLHTLWHIGALCRAANGKWVTTVPERVCKARGRGGVRCTVIGCPNKALCKRWRSLIAICLNVCYTIFQRLTLCNPSSYPTHSPPSLSIPCTPCCCLLLLRCAFYFRCSMIFNLSESTLPSTVPGVIERQHHHPPPCPTPPACLI